MTDEEESRFWAPQSQNNHMNAKRVSKEAFHQSGIQNGPQARATKPQTEEGRSLDQGLPAARSSGRHRRRDLSPRIPWLMRKPGTQRGALTPRRQRSEVGR